MTDSGLRILGRIPTPEELMSLRASVGWELYDLKVAGGALEQSLFGVCLATDDEARVVGCARVIGDSYYRYVQDVIVHPSWQNMGGGTQMMIAIRAWLDAYSVGTYRALICPPESVSFYKRLGFANEGMAMRLPDPDGRSTEG